MCVHIRLKCGRIGKETSHERPLPTDVTDLCYMKLEMLVAWKQIQSQWLLEYHVMQTIPDSSQDNDEFGAWLEIKHNDF